MHPSGHTWYNICSSEGRALVLKGTHKMPSQKGSFILFSYFSNRAESIKQEWAVQIEGGVQGIPGCGLSALGWVTR